MVHRLLFLSGCWLFLFSSLSQLSARADSICQAETTMITTTLTGFTRPKTFLDITPEVSGRCEEVQADVGEPTPLDTVFARLDPTFIVLELQANNIANTQTKRSLIFEKKQVKRYRQLVTTKASAQTRLEELELQYDQTQLKLQQLETEQKRLSETLARHTLHAPAGWLVIRRQIEPGEWVRAGQPIARVGDYQHLVVPVVLRPEELSYLQSAQTFPLNIVDNNIQGMGSILRVEPNFDSATRKTKVDIALTDATLKQVTDKRGGLRVEIPIILQDPMEAFSLPAAAIKERYEENWLTRENGETFRVIVLGPELSTETTGNRRLRVVSEKIKEGDRFQCRKTTPVVAQPTQQTKGQ